MSPLELRTAKSFRESTGIDKSKTINPTEFERISLSYFGPSGSDHKGKIYLEASCDEDDENGKVELSVEREGAPVTRPKVYKFKKGGPKQYVSRDGYSVVEMQMVDNPNPQE